MVVVGFGDYHAFVTLEETIQVSVNRAFNENWFNNTNNFNIFEGDLIELLTIYL